MARSGDKDTSGSSSWQIFISVSYSNREAFYSNIILPQTPTLTSKATRERRKTKPKVSIRKEMVKIGAEINDTGDKDNTGKKKAVKLKLIF